MADGLTDLPTGIELRPAAPEDRDFLLAVYESTRDEELSVVPWSDADKAAFLMSQFDAQDTSYRQAYPDGRFLVVVMDSRPIGRLSLARLEDELRIVDIALLSAYRGTGIGSGLMASIIGSADREGIPVTLHIEVWNPARRLYERFGFVSEGPRGIYEFMRRPATAQLKTAS